MLLFPTRQSTVGNNLKHNGEAYATLHTIPGQG